MKNVTLNLIFTLFITMLLLSSCSINITVIKKEPLYDRTNSWSSPTICSDGKITIPINKDGWGCKHGFELFENNKTDKK